MSRLTDKELIDELKRRFDEQNQSIKELKKLTGELKIVNKKLEESEALKSHFISNITNEIINPFTSIIGLSKNILSVSKEDWKKVISMVALIHSEAFNLDFQLRNIFVAAKIEAGEIYPEIMSVDLKALIKSVVESFRVEAQKKLVTIDHEFNCIPNKDDKFYFKTDPEKIKLILANLLSNAVKFSLPKNKVEIKAESAGEHVILMVRDYGTGITFENQKIIFDRFRRLDSGINSMNRGHGLGLSINKALLDLLEGTIEIESKENEGTTFTIKVPNAVIGTKGFSADGNEFLFDEDEVF
ncbi:MAG: sensor histidine kinase [Bacteroidota bacterium]